MFTNLARKIINIAMFYYETYRDNSIYVARKDCLSTPHFHRAPEIAYVIRGEKPIRVNDTLYLLKEGDFLMLMPYDVHEYLPSDGEQICAAFPPEDCAEFLAAAKNLSLESPVFLHGAFTEDLFAHMILLQEKKNPVFLRGLINYILGSVLQEGNFSPKQSAQQDLLREIFAYIDEHFAEELTLQSVATRFGYSKYYFSRLFNAHVSANFSAYVNQVRVYKSIPLLKKYKISAVYAECGFRSPQQYFLNFRKATGKSPREYLAERKKHD